MAAWQRYMAASEVQQRAGRVVRVARVAARREPEGSGSSLGVRVRAAATASVRACP